MVPRSLSVTIVTFRTAQALLDSALASLARAIAEARAAGELGTAQVHVVDNSPADARAGAAAAVARWPSAAGSIRLHAGHGNLGYGRANNLVLPLLASDVHLVMNPDVELEPAALREAMRALREHEDVGLVAPDARDRRGEREYLCKRYPSVAVLFLRGFAPAWMRRRFRARIDDYEMRDVVAERFVAGIPLASGCFMLVRTALFKRLGGFDERFFMYFEDYDLSARLGREAAIAYEPRARIVHHGGEAARKGLRHVGWFVASAWRFFARHGWKA